MSGKGGNAYLVSSDGKEALDFDDAAMQIIQGQLGIRGILRGSKPQPRFLVQLLNALRERSGMVEKMELLLTRGSYQKASLMKSWKHWNRSYNYAFTKNNYAFTKNKSKLVPA